MLRLTMVISAGLAINQISTDMFLRDIIDVLDRLYQIKTKELQTI